MDLTSARRSREGLPGTGKESDAEAGNTRLSSTTTAWPFQLVPGTHMEEFLPEFLSLLNGFVTCVSIRESKQYPTLSW